MQIWTSRISMILFLNEYPYALIAITSKILKTDHYSLFTLEDPLIVARMLLILEYLALETKIISSLKICIVSTLRNVCWVSRTLISGWSEADWRLTATCGSHVKAQAIFYHHITRVTAPGSCFLHQRHVRQNTVQKPGTFFSTVNGAEVQFFLYGNRCTI